MAWGKMDDATNLVIHGIYELIDSVPLSRFKAAAFDLVRRLISFESGLWAEGEATLPPVPHSVYLHNLPDGLLEDYFRFVDEDDLYRTVVACSGRTLGRDLGISPSTVTNRVNRTYKKLNIS